MVELDLTQPDSVTGRYFYQKYRQDIPPSGKLSGNILTLHEILYQPDTKEKVPSLVISKEQDKWSGQWQDATAKKKLPVTLSPLQAKAPEADADPYWQTLYRTHLYDYVRMQVLELKKGKSEQFMGHQLQWWTEPRTNTSYFEVKSGYDQSTLSYLNQLLRSRFWSAVNDYYDCQLSASRHGGDFNQELTLGLMTPSIFSINVFTSYNCGGAHPDFSNNPINIDVKSRQPLLLEDVLWLGEGKPFHFNPADDTKENASKNSVNYEQYRHYRSTRLAPWLISQLSKLAPNEMKKPQDPDTECDYTNPEVWPLPTWNFTANGILFNPYFARVQRACEGPEWAVVPYQIIRQHSGSKKLTLPE